MTLNFTIEIADAMALQLLKAKGHTIIKHVFVDTRNQRSNNIVNLDNDQPAVIIDQKIYSIKDGLEQLYNYDLKRSFFNVINRAQ